MSLGFPWLFDQLVWSLNLRELEYSKEAFNLSDLIDYTVGYLLVAIVLQLVTICQFVQHMLLTLNIKSGTCIDRWIQTIIC